MNRQRWFNTVISVIAIASAISAVVLHVHTNREKERVGEVLEKLVDKMETVMRYNDIQTTEVDPERYGVDEVYSYNKAGSFYISRF